MDNPPIDAKHKITIDAHLQSLDKSLTGSRSTEDGMHLSSATNAAEGFLDYVRTLEPDEQRYALNQARAESRSHMDDRTIPRLDINFDGKSGELTEFKLVYPEANATYWHDVYIPVTVDLYKPSACVNDGKIVH